MRVDFQIALLAIFMGLFGCAAQSPVQVEDSERANYILVTALDAWRSGQVDSLTKRSTPIRFADDDQKAGSELLDYELADEAAPIRPFQNIVIVLSLRDKSGQTSRKTARYQVGVEPRLTVLRADN